MNPVLHNRKDFSAHLFNYLSTRPNVTPRCVHFGVCGGCSLQNYDYADQVAAKQEVLKQLFKPLLSSDQLDTYAVVGAASPYEYRVKMEYVMSVGKLGLRLSRRFNDVIDLRECHLIKTELFAKLRELHKYMQKLQIPDYDLVADSGFMKYFVVKDMGEQVMLNLIVDRDDYADAVAGLAQQALELGFGSVNLIKTAPGSDTTFGEVLNTWGEPYINMNLRDKRYLIGPNTFTQNNLAGFVQILDYIQPELVGSKHVFDLYCGVGTIAIQFADQVETVTAVDEISDSTELGKQNAQLNGVNNIKFHTARVADFLHQRELFEYDYYKHSDLTTRYKTDHPHYDTIIVDPARPGLETKVCRRLLKYFDAEKIIYISCNPVTQKQDLDKLVEKYDIKSIRGFDLFPQTMHVENVTILTKKT